MSERWPHTIVATVFAAALLAGSGSTLAEKGYYKWMDERGNPQHSDRPPPPGVEYEFVSTDTGLRRRMAAEDDSSGSSAPALPVASTAIPADAGDEIRIEKDKDMCDRAQANLDTLNSSARIRIRDGDDIRYLTDEEKAIQRRKAEDLIAIHCGS